MADVEENTKTAIEEDELELSLSLRCSSSSSSVHLQQPHNKNILEPSSSASNGHQILTKRDAQAIRRHEAKLKRDFKRKASALAKNDVVGNNNNNNANNNNNHVQEEEDYSVERRRKVRHLGFQAAAPPWLGWNAGGAGGYNGSFMSFQGYNGNFGDGKDGGCAGSLSSGSSSGISDNNNYPGGNSSDAGSHSSHPHLQVSPPNISRACTTISQPQPCSSQLDLTTNGSNPSQPIKPQVCNLYSNKTELMSGSGSRRSSKSPEVVTSNVQQHNEAYSTNNEKTVLSDKHPSSTTQSGSCPNKETKGEIGKPPKPGGLTGQQKLIYSNMPCVTTTGNGPNGKTVTGFLCKYSKGEVSIVCVCHGTSFSPAAFVEHAGGVDVEYPLRHIRVALPLTNHLS